MLVLKMVKIGIFAFIMNVFFFHPLQEKNDFPNCICKKHCILDSRSVSLFFTEISNRDLINAESNNVQLDDYCPDNLRYF